MNKMKGQRLSNFLLFFLSLIFVCYSLLSVETRLNTFLTVNIPLSAKFPIPVLFWLGVIVYIVAVSITSKLTFKELMRSGIVLGFCTHFIILLLNLNTRDANAGIPWSSAIYKLYFKSVLVFGLCILSIAGGILFRILFTEYRSRYAGFIYTIPLLFVYSWANMFMRGSYTIVFVMSMLFIFSFYIKAKERVYLKLKGLSSNVLQIILNEKVFLILIFLASMFFRVVFLKRVMTDPHYILTASDGRMMNSLARKLLMGELPGDPRSRGYWTFLAGLYYFFNKDYFMVGVVQSLYGTLAILMMYIIAKKTFGIVTARIAAIIAVLDYPLIFSATGLGHEAMDIFYGVLIVYLLMRFREKGINPKGVILLSFTGFICGLAMANREVNALLPLVASVWLICLFWRSQKHKIRLLGAISLFLLFCVLGIAPFLYWNYQSSGRLYESNTYNIPRLLGTGTSPLNTLGFDPRYDFSGSMSFVFQHPIIFLKNIFPVWCDKFQVLYLSHDYGGFDPIFLVRANPPANYFLAMYFYVYLLTLVGLVFAFLSRKVDKAILFLVLLFLAYKTAVHLWTISLYRYRASLELLLIMLTAYGLCVLINFARNKRIDASHTIRQT